MPAAPLLIAIASLAVSGSAFATPAVPPPWRAWANDEARTLRVEAETARDAGNTGWVTEAEAAAATLVHEIDERYADQPEHAVDAKIVLAISLARTKLLASASDIILDLRRIAPELPNHPEPLRRVLYAQGIVGLVAMQSGYNEPTRESQQRAFDQGRRFIGDATRNPAMTGEHYDALMVQWCVVEPVASARETLVERLIQHARETENDTTLLVTAFHGAVRAADRDTAAERFGIAASTARKLARARDALMIELVEGLLLAPDRAELTDLAKEVSGQLIADVQAAGDDQHALRPPLALLTAFSGLLLRIDEDLAVRTAEDALGLADIHLDATASELNTIRLSHARVLRRVGRPLPDGYAGPDPDTHSINATFGYQGTPPSPWNPRLRPVLTADLVIVEADGP